MHRYIAQALLTTLVFGGSVLGQALPQGGWTASETIGAAIAGNAVLLPDGVYEVTTYGYDIWGERDTFHYLYKELTGDGAIICRVLSNGTGWNEWSKGGVMIREHSTPSSKYSMMVVTGGGGGGAAMQSRVTQGGYTGIATATATPPCWVKLERYDNHFSGFLSYDGVLWTQVGTTTPIAMQDTVLIGLCASGGAPRTYAFDNVSFVGNVSEEDFPVGAASYPLPRNGKEDVAVNATLSWVPGINASQHDVYLGQDFHQVNEGTTDSPAYMGRQTEPYYTPDNLEPGEIYFWRIDESRSASDENVIRGTTWSFTVQLDAPSQDHRYPHQNGVAGVAFTGIAPAIEHDSPAGWTLVKAPAGMTIDYFSGVATWANPIAGTHRIRVRATYAAGYDIIEWHLLIADAYADQILVATKHVDFVVPLQMAWWMNQWQPHELIDGAWEWLRDTVGQQTYSGRQMVLLDPSMGGGAHSGNPIRMGPNWWTDDPIHGWYVFTTLFVHEHAHNAHGLVSIPGHDDWPWFDPFVHHMCEFAQQAFIADVLQNPEQYGLRGEAWANYQAFTEWLENDYQNRYWSYGSWLDQGGTARDFSGDTYGAWQKIVHDLAGDFGPAILRDTLLAYRPDGLPKSLRNAAYTSEHRVTLLFSVLSALTGTDLRQRFRNLGFPVDDDFFAVAHPQVEQAIANLPTAGYQLWHQSPLNGHSYALTSLDIEPSQASRCASRAGGELVTIRSSEEMEWLKTTFGSRPFWIGLSDASQEGRWTWPSGERATYTNWMTGEPNGGSQENYAATNWWDQEGWIDVSGDFFFQGIIEKQDPTTPGTPDGPSSAQVEDFETGDLSAFDWSCYGYADWFVTPNEHYSGSYSAQAGSIGDDGSTSLSVTLDCVAGDITFWCRVSSESHWDCLRFYINESEKGAWSGDESWSEVSFPVKAGRRTFTWTYSKDESLDSGQDTCWIDDVVFPVE
ncbi:MAG: C-type lectin domain-containing protein [Sedimentisphaerales bacterium]|nr:C-type lectin domain-containing protein [Sedimentisphaerales bacterium]